MMHPPRWQRHFLRLARFIALERSKDPSTKQGAVIVAPNKHEVSSGHNGFPMGLEDNKEMLANRAAKYNLTVHAEHNAILLAPGAVTACALYTWPLPPCVRCAGAIRQAGVAEVLYPTPSRNSENYLRWRKDHEWALWVFKKTGIRVKEISLK